MTRATPPVLDHDAALCRVGGDLELLREIGVLFATECPLVIEEMRQALAQANPAAIGRAAHGLKGSMANFGAAAGVHVASLIEQRVHGGQIEDLGHHIDQLEEILNCLIAELKLV